ncbi:hypothetical protein PUY80_15610 [Plantibacter flavus]|uniref:Rv3654c family TadE-like protein n=1 Tax=Plantibacter flavus TaxID=150123 RepID=UPI002378090C|nr:Rv3654c family TadE-like protein [Plantibacter flavus]MDD9153995.1 hypothetical protein [Plantibacter flavus]
MSVQPSRAALSAVRSLRDETGAGSVLAAGVLGALVAVLLATLPVVTLFAAHQRAANAADAAALAAADTASGRLPGFPCETARMVAARNAASLGTCSVEGVTVLVDATVDTAFGAITVAARAGPPPEASGAVVGVPATATY